MSVDSFKFYGKNMNELLKHDEAFVFCEQIVFKSIRYMRPFCHHLSIGKGAHFGYSSRTMERNKPKAANVTSNVARYILRAIAQALVYFKLNSVSIVVLSFSFLFEHIFHKSPFEQRSVQEVQIYH
jgi:hypothetical protein